MGPIGIWGHGVFTWLQIHGVSDMARLLSAARRWFFHGDLCDFLRNHGTNATSSTIVVVIVVFLTFIRETWPLHNLA